MVRPPCGIATLVEKDSDSAGQAGESMIMGRVEVSMAKSTVGKGGE